MTTEDIFGVRQMAQGETFSSDQKRETFFRDKFDLKWNPFPEIGVPDTEVNDMAPIRGSAVQQVGTWVTKALRDRKLSILMVKGSYGSGKSFLLIRIISEVTEAFSGKSQGRPKVVYVYRPSVEAQALNRAIMEEIGLDNIRKMIWVVIRDQLLADLQLSPKPVALDNLLTQLMLPSGGRTPAAQTLLTDMEAVPKPLARVFNLDDMDDYRRFLYNFDGLKRKRQELRSYFVDLLTRGLTNLGNATSAAAFVDLLLAYEDAEAWQSFLHMQIPRRDRALYVRQFMQDLIALLQTDGYVYLLVVIDEFEQVTESRLLTPREQADYAYTMLEIINQIHDGLGLIISITEEGFQKLNQVAPLGDRLFAQVELTPLTNNEIGDLARFYLDQARYHQRVEASELFPFSPVAIAVMAERLRPVGLGTTPRNVVQFFHHLLEYCFTNDLQEINVQVVEEFAQYFRAGKTH